MQMDPVASGTKRVGGFISPTEKTTAINGSMDFPFVISTDRQKADPQTRRLIRSHVMHGKNRVKPRRKPRVLLHGEQPETDSSTANELLWAPGIPKILCSKFSAICFADDVEPALIADVLSFSSMASKAMFLLDRCIIPTTDGLAQTWFAPMLSDAAYLHAACFTIQAYFDRFLGRMRGAEAQQRDRMYYAKTVRILQERLELDNDSVRLSDSTIMTVLALSGHAYTIGDYESALHHYSGLLKLVSMRGIGTFSQNTKLLIEILRCDLCMALDTGSEPVLFTYDDIPWPLTSRSGFMAVLNEEDLSEQIRGEDTGLENRLNPELAAIWVAMSHFCALVNEAAESDGPKIAEEVFLHSMGSMLYRLLHQRFETGSLDEAYRLGLLAFSSPIFLHWNRVELPDRQFTSAYRRALDELNTKELNLAPKELLWLLMVGGMSMCHEPEGVAWLRPWLHINSELCEVVKWDSMKALLSSFMWIGLVYDEPGKDVFDSIML